MNKDEYEAYQRETSLPPQLTISVGALDTCPGTLAYGYTCDRDTWHAYIENGELHVVVYGSGNSMLAGACLLDYCTGTQLPIEVMRPDKRVYPDTVDSAFALLMHRLGHPLPFIGNFDWSSSSVAYRAAAAAKNDGFYGQRYWQL